MARNNAEKDRRIVVSKEILIGFRNGQPASMKLHDVFGNVTVLTLSALEQNPTLTERAFHFEWLAGVDVVQEYRIRALKTLLKRADHNFSVLPYFRRVLLIV